MTTEMCEGPRHLEGQQLSLRLLVTISQSLAGLVQGMLGPCGQQTLLSTHTGRVLVTRDGLTVLSSLHLSHPVARCMTDSLRSHHAVHGDGSKTFILYLAELLKAIDYHVTMEGNGHCASFSRLKLSLELNKFLHTDFEQITKLFFKKLNTHSTGGDKDDFVWEAKAVMLTSLHTCLQRPLAEFMAELLSAFLHLHQQKPSSCKLSHMLQHFDMYHSKVCTQPQQRSRVCQGVVLETDLQPFLHSQTGAKNNSFALMDIEFDDEGKQRDGNAVFIKATSGKLTDLLSYKRNLLKRFLSRVKVVGVQVVISAETAPQYVTALCQEEGISLQCLSREKVSFLRDLTGVNVLTELNQGGLEKCVFTATVCSFIHIGNKVCTVIQPNEKCCVFSNVNHIVLCAPTEGVCDQLCQSVYKALKTLSLCLQSDAVESNSVSVHLNSSLPRWQEYGKGTSAMIGTTDSISSGNKSAETDPVNKSAETDPVNKNAETDPVNKSAETDPVNKSAETDPVNKSAETDPVNKNAETDPVNKSAETDPVNKSAETDPVNKNAETDPVNKSAETDPVNKSAETDPVNKSAETDPANKDKLPTRPAKVLHTVKSGGAFEAVLSTAITDFYASEHAQQRRGISTLIQKMLAAVPKTLHSSLSSSQHAEKRQFTEKWTTILSMVHRGCVAGLDQHGEMCSSRQSVRAEPVDSKVCSSRQSLRAEPVDSEMCSSRQSVCAEPVDSKVCSSRQSLRAEPVDSEVCSSRQSVCAEPVDSEVCSSRQSVCAEPVDSKVCSSRQSLRAEPVDSEVCSSRQSLRAEPVDSEVCSSRQSVCAEPVDSEVCSSRQSVRAEPVASKVCLVKNVLQLVIQLLRVEAVVPVKSVKRLPGSGCGPSSVSESESNKEDENVTDEFG